MIFAGYKQRKKRLKTEILLEIYYVYPITDPCGSELGYLYRSSESRGR
jgi:hypothetical protein